jgi:RNA polymerase sigma-70 factor (ECF subfamily)
MTLERTVSPSQTSVEDLRRLYELHGARLRQAIARVAPTLDADDLLHETFVIALQKLGELDRVHSPQAWLYGVALKLAATRRRTSKLRRFLGLEDVRDVSGVDASSRTIDQRDAQRRVDAALQTLSDAKREVFVLFELQGLSGDEIAQACGIPVKTVWTRLFHARRDVTASIERALLIEARTSGLPKDEVRP